MATSSDRVYRQIREGILAGEYAVGDRLREGELATQFGVSRTPVRIALQRLVNDRLIDFTAHAGAIVRGYADAEMVEILEIRALLEPQGARLAALNRKQEHLDELFELCARMETLGDRSEPDFGQIAPLNNRFHQVLLDASGQRQLLVVTTSLIELNNVVQSYRKFARADVDRSFAEHRQQPRPCRACQFQVADRDDRRPGQASDSSGIGLIRGLPARKASILRRISFTPRI